jgi:NAD(P)-dependent dehydrogenase (short-subunit alcohol dehydrogenase family)
VLISNAGVLNEYGPKVGDTNGDKFWADIVCHVSSILSTTPMNSPQTVNTRGPYLLSHGLINFNTANHPATFITLTTGVTEPYPSMTGYFLSKLPPIKLTQILDLEYPNLRTYAVMPGINDTDMLLDAFRPLALDKRELEHLHVALPTDTSMILASLIGGLTVYLCSPFCQEDSWMPAGTSSRW